MPFKAKSGKPYLREPIITHIEPVLRERPDDAAPGQRLEGFVAPPADEPLAVSDGPAWLSADEISIELTDKISAAARLRPGTPAAFSFWRPNEQAVVYSFTGVKRIRVAIEPHDYASIAKLCQSLAFDLKTGTVLLPHEPNRTRLKYFYRSVLTKGEWAPATE